MIVRLKPEELRLLAEMPEIPAPVRERVLVASEKGGVAELECSRDQAIEVGDALTLLLARTGFDADDDVTAEGRGIEDLIDKFFVE